MSGEKKASETTRAGGDGEKKADEINERACSRVDFSVHTLRFLSTRIKLGCIWVLVGQAVRVEQRSPTDGVLK